jgi:DNA-binding NarL/FixJ family response regulator
MDAMAFLLFIFLRDGIRFSDSDSRGPWQYFRCRSASAAINTRINMTKILIADDHALVRAGYKQFLMAERSITEVGEASSGSETLAELRRKHWDLLLMDIHMPDRSGIDILKHVTMGYPNVRVLIMSGLAEEQYARTVLRSGARGYLSKGGSPGELLKAVRLVLNGNRYVSATLAESMAADLEKPHDQDQPLHIGLSTREFQIFRKIAIGASLSAIAKELSLSVKTVSTYRSRILEKMDFKTNADVTGYALRSGLIQ